MTTTTKVDSCIAPGCHSSWPRMIRGLCLHHYDQWRKGRTGLPVLPSSQVRDMTTGQVIEATGATYRQLDYWCRTGRIAVDGDSAGSGRYRRWSEADVEVITRIVQRIEWGMTLEAASRSVDPPLPPAIGGDPPD